MSVYKRQKFKEQIDVIDSSCNDLPQMSVILYSGSLLFKLVQYCSLIPNPLQITHCGVIIHISGYELLKLLNANKFKNLSQRFRDVVRKNIFYSDQIVRPYIIEARSPCVVIAPVDITVNGYPGNIYLRKPLVQYDQILFEWTDLIGLPYKMNVQMLLAGWSLNSKEDSTALFCSELVALLMKRARLLNVNSSNIIPKELGSAGQKADILRNICQKEIQLKLYVNETSK
ncbi:Papain-like_cysteine peptidase superfamily [Hexamita inflata]|uniref:Papain-like cysteine peptidase superfamily n=1 Tax=Hexamita inflata TaxID=28002 RepID=A0AA86QZR6_9EUKA|nr:Papain-like cysteine peptidase superfamily [Hexamita inflata]